MAGESLTWFHAPSPANDELISAVESVIGYRFPGDFRLFAKSYSGGSPNETDFEFFDSETGTFYAAVSEFFTFFPEDARYLVRWMERTEFFPSGLVPFAVDGGGNYVCFDFRSESNNPSVVFWHSGRRGLENEVNIVAKTFSDFLELLHEPDDAGDTG